MRGQVNGLTVNTGVVNGSGAEGILFAHTWQVLDVLQGVMAVQVDIEAMLASVGQDVALTADGALDVSAQTLADIADLVIEAHASSVIDAHAVATLDHNMLTVYMREPLRRHAPGSALDRHAAGSLVSELHDGAAILAEHGANALGARHAAGSPIVRH